MPNKLELSGRRFGKLLVTREAGRDQHGAVMWECLCDCGKITVPRGAELRRGVTRSCGCGVAEKARQPRTHGATHTPLYRRHHNVCHAMHDAGIGPLGAEEGFVTSAGRWVWRKPALELARLAGQIIRETAPAHGLFSEDVW